MRGVHNSLAINKVVGFEFPIELEVLCRSFHHGHQDC